MKGAWRLLGRICIDRMFVFVYIKVEMQFFGNSFAMFTRFMGRHTWLAAFLFCILCFVAASILAPPALQNDDMQLQYLLVGGGEAGSVFSIYSNVALASVLQMLTDAWPSVCWYLALLTGVVFMSLWVLTGCVFERIVVVSRDVSKTFFFIVSRICLFVFMCYYTYESMDSVQYTQVGILSVLAALWLMFSAASKGKPRFSADEKDSNVCREHVWWRWLVSGLLWCIGIALRWDVCLTGAFFAVGFGLALLWNKEYRKGWKAYAVAIGVLAVCAAGLKWVQSDAYSRDEAWQQAERFLQARVEIQDYPDASGDAKLPLYAELGICPHEVKAFKSFIYVDALADETLLQRMLTIHKAGRPGLFGWECSSRLGIPPFTGERMKEMLSQPLMLTVWVPLACLLILFLCSTRKREGRVVWPVVACFACYIAVLFVVNRPVERVMNPAIAVCAFVVGAWMPARGEQRLFARKVGVFLVGAFCVVCVLFVFRHYPSKVSDALRGNDERMKAMQFCQFRPKTLFLSLTQQGGLGLFPEGYCGFTLDYVRNTNVLPIGDGWMFYTPAYQWDLMRRGISDPYRALVDESMDVVLITRGAEQPVPQYVVDMVQSACMVPVWVQCVGKAGSFVFWEFRRLHVDR